MGTNRTLVVDRDTRVIAGIDKHVSSPITIQGTLYTPDALKAEFQAEIDLLDAIRLQRGLLTDAVVHMKAKGKSINAIYKLLRWALIAQYGTKANAALHEFGMTAPKEPGPRTVKAKATAEAKSKATRKARHTMGKKQKQAVKGDVSGIVVTPVVAAAPAATTSGDSAAVASAEESPEAAR